MNKSLFLKLNQADFLKSGIVVVIVAVLAFVQTLLESKGFNISAADLSQLVQIALTAGVGYLAKNLLSNSDDNFGKKENNV